MRRSRKFSNRKKNDDILLYVMCILALIQIFYLVVRRKYTSLLFFCIVGVLLNMFIKNISIVLILDILITNILMRTVIRREGMTAAENTEKDNNKQAKETEKKNVAQNKLDAKYGTTTPASDATDATPAPVESSAKGTSTPETVPATSTTPSVEPFSNHDKKLQGVNKSIQMLSNLMDKFSSISGQLNYN